MAWATRYPMDSAPWHAHLAAGLIDRSAEWSSYGHPLQLYFLGAILVTGGCLMWVRRRQRYDGELLLWFMVLNGISKGALESLRYDYVASLQVYSFAMAVIGAAVLGAKELRLRSAAVPESSSR